MLALSFSAFDPGCVKRAWAKDAQNCFLNCLLPKAVTSTIDSYIDKIEMEVLHASWASEFSHGLDPKRTLVARLSGVRGMPEYLPSATKPTSRNGRSRNGGRTRPWHAAKYAKGGIDGDQV
jgi:hypothetical protein